MLVASIKGGEVGKTAKQPTPTGGPDDVIAMIARLVEEVGGGHRIGIGAPGQVDRHGVVTEAPNLSSWEGQVPLAERVAAAVGGKATVRVDNDVNVAVLGEHRHGAARHVDNALGVWVGTGVGGGLILDGEPRRGPTGMAAEIGHMVVHPGGRRCGCGFDGHLEAYAGRGRLEVEARRRHAAGEATMLVKLAGDERMRSGTFAKALDAGDNMAVDLIDQAVTALGVALASAQNLVDLDLIVVGGGLAEKLGPTFVGRIEQAVRALLWPGSSLRVVPSTLGDDAGVIGAATMVS